MSDVRFDVQDGIALLTLDRPDAMNVLTPGMMNEIGRLYAHCDRDDAVKVVLLTNSGGVFCAGADLSSGDVFATETGEDFSSCPLPVQAWDVRKPVIAACAGHAIGIGLSMALQCDLRVFALESRYGIVQNRRGVVADFAVEYLLPRLVGFERAFELIVGGARIDGAQALDWRLAGRAVPQARVLETALELAAGMARNCAPLVMGIHKRLLWRGLDLPREAFVDLETRALRHSMRNPDALEGGMAWVEKREPRWVSSVTQDWPDFL